MKRGPGKRQTAEEIERELANDPEYQQMRARQQEAARAFEDRLHVAEAPLREALRSVGFNITSVWDLVNTRASYAAAIPVLLEHFQRDYPPEVREGIARSLGVREASWAWNVLLSFFHQEPEGGPRNVKFALACALSGAASDDVIDDIIELLRDRTLGENRLILLRALARSSRQEAQRVLEELREDPQLSREIRALLRQKNRNS